MQKYAEEPSAYKYTSDDLQALKPFIAHLRNSLILAQEESDAHTPEGAVTYPLSTEFVRTKIKTDPTLRYLWRRLTPAQKAYAENRYIQNTPTRYETMPAMTPNPFAAPLEHDYQLTHNPSSYKTGRVIQNAQLSLSQPGMRAGFIGNFVVKPAGKVMDFVVGRIPGMARTEGFSSSDVSGDAEVALRRGGYPQKSGVMAPVQQPLSPIQRGAEEAVLTATPMVTDVALLKGVSGALPAGSRAAAVAESLANFQNPLNIFVNPTKWWSSFDDAAKLYPKLTRAWQALELFSDTGEIYDKLRGTYAAGNAANSNNVAPSAQLSKDVEAANFGGSKDLKERERIQRYKEYQNKSVQEAQTPKQTPAIADWISRYKIPAASALVGGGLGAALDRRSRLRGFLVGSLLGAVAPALYNYVKKRYS